MAVSAGDEPSEGGVKPEPQGFQEVSTKAAAPREVVDYWHYMTNEVLNLYRVTPHDPEHFRGRISWMEFPEFRLSVVDSVGQVAEVTRRMAENVNNETFAAVIAESGSTRYEERELAISVGPREWFLADSRHPRTLSFPGPFRLIVVSVPLHVAESLIPVRIREASIGRCLPSSGGLGMVADFFRSLVGVAGTDPEAARLLSAQAPSLLSSAVFMTQGSRPEDSARDAFLREQALTFMRGNLGDPTIDSDTIAGACSVSRRTLYRLFTAEGTGTVIGVLRRMRIDRAKALLATSPHRGISAIGQACGFASDRQFYRAFRAATTMSPAEYRDRARGIPTAIHSRILHGDANAPGLLR